MKEGIVHQINCVYLHKFRNFVEDTGQVSLQYIFNVFIPFQFIINKNSIIFLGVLEFYHLFVYPFLRHTITVIFKCFFNI